MGLGETSAFLLLTLVTTLLASIAVLFNRSVSRAQAMALGFYFFAVVISVVTLFYILAGDTGLVLEDAQFLRWLQPLLFRGGIVIGVAISSALLVLLNSAHVQNASVRSGAVRSFVTSRYLLRGLCFSVALSFLCTEVGKLAHHADMQQFFLQSGYAVWFLYVIIAAETLGAIGLLIPRTTVPAAIGLMMIMLGAIRTHAHNGDPFSDSLEALQLLALLACILIIRLLRGKVPVA
jgi:uncharacterized membrane protein YphA (DoxX/SURF4 family)